MNHNRPLIGITSSMSNSFIRMKRTYFDAVLAAGGIPVFMPHSGGAEDAAKFVELFDGFLFAGGDDVDPKYYGEEVTADNVELTPIRDEFEFALINLLKDDPRPILGICRGEQVLNVAFGGSLHQDIPGHRQEEAGTENLRAAHIKEGTLLAKLAGKDTVYTNSFHHQAVKSVAPGFVISATADDGTVEAIEPVGQPQAERFFLAVQWHPEIFFSTDEAASNIFKAFIEAAKQVKE